MPFDYKKEYKKFYMPKNKPEIAEIPPMNYAAVRGKGNPNIEGGDYQQAISILYAVSYTLKMSYKTDYKIEGFFEYVVPPLEGFWRSDICAAPPQKRSGMEINMQAADLSSKDAFHWISVIRLPDFVTEKDFSWAVRTASEKKKIDCQTAEFLSVEEGLCVQMMHLGSFDSESATIALMDDFLREQGYENDINEQCWHHEIYMSDPRKKAPEKWKTVIRHPIKKV